MDKPEVLKNELLQSEQKESGCCFRTCGGRPCIMDSDERTVLRQEIFAEIDRAIK